MTILDRVLSSPLPCGARTMIVQCYCDASMIYGLTAIFQICHRAEFNKIVEATISANPYNDGNASLQRLQRKQ